MGPSVRYAVSTLLWLQSIGHLQGKRGRVDRKEEQLAGKAGGRWWKCMKDNKQEKESEREREE